MEGDGKKASEASKEEEESGESTKLMEGASEERASEASKEELEEKKRRKKREIEEEEKRREREGSISQKGLSLGSLGSLRSLSTNHSPKHQQQRQEEEEYEFSDKETCVASVGPFVRQVSMAVLASFGGISNGIIYAFPAVALPRWQDDGIQLNTAQTTWFASAPMVVAVFTCVCAGVIVEKLGVRWILSMGSLILATTWVMLGFATTFWQMILARVIQGLIASLFMVIITVYPVEVSVVRWRGIMTGISEAMVMLGAFLTYLGGLILSIPVLSFTLAGIQMAQLLFIYFLRESPLWYARKNKFESAGDSLRFLRGSGDVDYELQNIKATVYIERHEKPTPFEQLLMLRKVIYLKPVSLCVFVLLFKELTGQYAALTYTVSMFRLAGSTLDPYLCAVAMGAARFLPCFLSWALIERLQRRLLLSSCLSICSLSFALLGGVLWYFDGVEGGLPDTHGWVPLLCISIFTLAYGCGVGPTSWTLVGELLPSQVRNVGAGLLVTCFSLFLSIIGFSFPYMVENLGKGGVFFIYSVCSLIGVVFVIWCLPETKGMSFIDIQKAVHMKTKEKTSNVV